MTVMYSIDNYVTKKGEFNGAICKFCWVVVMVSC